LTFPKYYYICKIMVNVDGNMQYVGGFKNEKQKKAALYTQS
jgi:hypothetical protein